MDNLTATRRGSPLDLKDARSRTVRPVNQADRPILGLAHDDGPVIAFVEGLQEGIDAADADRFNASFADDVLWGTPFGAVVDGYDTLHLIHTRMFAALPRGVGSVEQWSDNVDVLTRVDARAPGGFR